MKTNKRLDITSSKDLDKTKVLIFGNPDTWVLICKASNKSEGWMKSTKAMQIGSLGVVIQVTTQQGKQIAEAVVFVPGAAILSGPKGLFIGHHSGEVLNWED